MTTQRNEAAERWFAFYDDYDTGTMFISRTGKPDDIWLDGLPGEIATSIVDEHTAALATERRLTVERVKERVEALDNYDHLRDHVVLRWIDIRSILDDISKEGTP